MGDVIKFPPIADRSWIELERDLRKILVTGGATSEQADAILNRMKYDFSQPVGESIPVSPPFPDSVSAILVKNDCIALSFILRLSDLAATFSSR